MSEHLKKTLHQNLALFAIFSFVLVVTNAAAAWVPPTQAPTAANASPFLHTGPENQTKDGSFGVGTFATDQLCLGAHCKANWGVPDCRICVAAGVANGPLAAEQCVPFDNSIAYSGREDGSHGRGTSLAVRVVCP